MHSSKRNAHEDRTAATLPRLPSWAFLIVATKVRTTVVPNRRKHHLAGRDIEQVETEPTSTPTSTSPTRTAEHVFVHEIVNHAQKYVKGQVHTNGLENFWAC